MSSPWRPSQARSGRRRSRPHQRPPGGSASPGAPPPRLRPRRRGHQPPLSPMELRFEVPRSPLHHFLTVHVHLPCFLHSTSIELHGLDLLCTEPPPSHYMFPALETMSLWACRVDVHALVIQCPRLRVLRVTNCLHGDQDITVRSASLQELEVRSADKWTGHVAPADRFPPKSTRNCCRRLPRASSMSCCRRPLTRAPAVATTSQTAAAGHLHDLLRLGQGGLNDRRAGVSSCTTSKLEDPGASETDNMSSARHLAWLARAEDQHEMSDQNVKPPAREKNVVTELELAEAMDQQSRNTSKENCLSNGPTKHIEHVVESWRLIQKQQTELPSHLIGAEGMTSAASYSRPSSPSSAPCWSPGSPSLSPRR